MIKKAPKPIIDSAIALARAIIASDALDAHKREFLGYCIWKASEADGKYNVRYWSEGVLSLVEQHGTIGSVQRFRLLRHEHVKTRKSLVDAIMNDLSCAELVLREQAIACLFTDEEHRKLKDLQVGFERYSAAKIRVWDTNTQQWL